MLFLPHWLGGWWVETQLILIIVSILKLKLVQPGFVFKNY